MRNSIYLLFLLSAVALVSCKKDKSQPQNIKQYDDVQIKAYIAAKGYTGMQRDTVGGDTTGIYYQVISAGTGAPVSYSSELSYTYTVQSLDGKYLLSDTIANHAYNYLGNLQPPGLQLAIYNVVKRMGTRVRVIIPSRLAYGTNGTGLGSNHIAGNQSLDFYVNVVNNLSQLNGVTYTNTIDSYDSVSIVKYMAANNITGFTPITSGTYKGLYYKIRSAGTGTVPITASSVVNFDYRATLLNGTVAEPANYTTTNNAVNTTYYLSNPSGQVPALIEALMLAGTTGGKVTVIAPSRLAYGLTAVANYFPADSCVIFELTLDTITNT